MNSPWLLIEAYAARGWMLTARPSVRVDREIFVDEGAASGCSPVALSAHCPAIVAEFARGRFERMAS